MLALTRKPEESILIGDDIEIVVLECRAGRCKVGLKAPRDMKIIRKELTDNEQQRQIINLKHWTREREGVRPAA